MFKVVAIDSRDGNIEIQYFDGTLDETEPESWFSMRADPAEAPEDWTGSVDINTEDMPGSKRPQFLDWQNQLDLLDETDGSADTAGFDPI